MTIQRHRQSGTAVLVHLVHTYLWRIHPLMQSLGIEQRQPPSRYRYRDLQPTKEAMHIYNKTNKEIVAMAPSRSEFPTKKPLSGERGFRFTSERTLLNRIERNTLLVESTHLSSGQLNSVALTID